MHKIVFFASSLLIAGAMGQAVAKDRPSGYFIQPSDIDVADMLAPPPADESAINKAEIAELHRIEASRTPDEVAQAKADADERDIFIFKTVLGAGFNAQALPVTAELSSHVEADQMADTEPVKDVFPRLRPYVLDKSLHPVCKAKTKPDSYPSGHTMTGYLMALTLASILPEKRAAIFVRADQYAHDRLVCGVHHASDLAAGKEMAYALFGLMQDNPKFKAERAAAEVEIRQVLKLPAPTGDADHAAVK